MTMPGAAGRHGHTVLLQRVVETGPDGEPAAKIKVYDELCADDAEADDEGWFDWDKWLRRLETAEWAQGREAADRGPCRVIFTRNPREGGAPVQVMPPPAQPMGGKYVPPPNALPGYEVASKPNGDKAKPRRGPWSRMGIVPTKQRGDRGDAVDMADDGPIPAVDDPTRTEVPLEWKSGPSSPEMLQAVRKALDAKTRQWPSRRSRLLAEGAILRTVPLAFPHIVRDHVPGKLVLWGSDTGDPEEPTLRAVVLGGRGETLATIVLTRGVVSLQVRIDPDGAAEPDAQEHIKHVVSSLVKLPEATGTFVSQVEASKFALATASVVADELVDHALTVEVREIGEDSYEVRANVFHEFEGELVGECTALDQTLGHDPRLEDDPPLVLPFEGRLGSVPFEGDSDLAALWCGFNLMYGWNSIQVAEHKREVRDESGDGKYDTVLGRAAFWIQPGDDADVPARAAALKLQINPLMKWQDKETDAKVTKAIAECLRQVSSPDAILTVLVTGKPETTSWTVKVGVVVLPGLTTAVGTVEQTQSTLFTTHVPPPAKEHPDEAADVAARIIDQARDVSVVDPSVERSLIEDRIRGVLDALNDKGMNVSAQRYGRRLRIDLTGGIDDARAVVEARGKSAVEMRVRFPSGIAVERVRGVVDSLTEGMADSRYRIAGAAAAILAGRSVQPLTGLEVTLKPDGELVVQLHGSDRASQSVSIARDDHGGIGVTVERIERRRDQLRTVIDDVSDLLAEIVAGNPGLERTAASVADTMWSEAFATRTADTANGVRAKITLSSGPDGQCRIVPELFSDDTVVLLHDPVAVYGRFSDGASSVTTHVEFPAGADGDRLSVQLPEQPAAQTPSVSSESVRANEVGQFGRSDGQPVTSDGAGSRGRLPRVSRPLGGALPGGRNCAVGAVAELLRLYPEHRPRYRIRERVGRRGVRARALYEAVNSAAQFATYAEVVARLQDDGDLGRGFTAVLASVWKDGSGGHAYLARNIGGTVKFFDPHTGVWSEELPWTEDQVSKTVVGYLKPDGTALNELRQPATQLAHADEIGFVRGLSGGLDGQQ
ncbi:MAG: hypothetical protein J2P17_14445, partial [Mycobacterium sp.]|nr:hypothetical protein [Mycobacterium sp.]